jgi:hypothetical protein
MGQKRRFDPQPVTSGLPQSTDIARPADWSGLCQKPTLLSLGDSGKLVGSRGGVVGHLYSYFFLVVFLIGIAIVFLASEFGWRLGTRTEGHGASGNISALEQSLL